MTFSAASHKIKSMLQMRRVLTTLGLLSVLGVSGMFNFVHLNFPVGYHPDEAKKGRFVVEGTQDFKHPLMLLQLTRVLAEGRQEEDADVAVLLGRMVSAAAGVVVVALTYLIARRAMSEGWALVVAIAVAVTPILVMHAHYFKEDVVFTAAALLSLWLFFRVVERPTLSRVVWFGMALGIAFSSHYKSLLLLPFYIGAPVLGRGVVALSLRRYYLQLVAASVVAAGVFCLMNWPLFSNFAVFTEGFLYEADHALAGHNITVSPLVYFFSFHFIKSLLPGMTPLAAGAALAAVAAMLVAWRKLLFVDRLLLGYALFFYFAMEASALKPPPDFSRYVLPIVPALSYLTWRSMQWWLKSHRVIPWAIGLGIVITVLIPAYDSAQLVYHMARDTRHLAWEWLEEEGVLGEAYFEAYAHPRIGEENTQSASTVVDKLDALRAKGVAVVVTSSFQYERFSLGAQLPGQAEAVYKAHTRYQALFTLPYREFTPVHHSYAFSNPTIRIVDIRQK